jgi:hypothetical protein
MAQPTDNGIFLIQPKTQYAFPKTDEEIANQTEQEKAEEKAAMEEFVHEHFMTPDFVKWSLPAKRQVSAAALGGYHLVVVARVEGSWQTMVYASGCNGEGQLGLGDVINRHALTRVRLLWVGDTSSTVGDDDASCSLTVFHVRRYLVGSVL